LLMSFVSKIGAAISPHVPHVVASAVDVAVRGNVYGGKEANLVALHNTGQIAATVIAAAGAPHFAGLAVLINRVSGFALTGAVATAQHLRASLNEPVDDAIVVQVARSAIAVALTGVGIATAYVLGYDPLVGGIVGTLPTTALDTRDLAIATGWLSESWAPGPKKI
jgi:hypothetical protein